MVETEVNLEGLVDGAVGDLGHRLTERLEVVGLCLVSEDVAVDEKEDAFLCTRFPEAPDDLKGGIGLACACGHDEEDAVFSPGDGLHGPVDGDELVVARGFSGAVVVVILGGELLLGGRPALGGTIARPQFVGRRKVVEGDFARDRTAGRRAVMLQKSVTVGAVGERDVQNLCVFQRLLHPCANAVGVVLGLHDSKWEIRLVGENVVGLLGFAASDGFAMNDHAAFREVDFLPNLHHDVPLVAIWPNQCGRDELGADVRFGECSFVHDASARGIRSECQT